MTTIAQLSDLHLSDDDPARSTPCAPRWPHSWTCPRGPTASSSPATSPTTAGPRSTRRCARRSRHCRCRSIPCRATTTTSTAFSRPSRPYRPRTTRCPPAMCASSAATRPSRASPAADSRTRSGSTPPSPRRPGTPTIVAMHHPPFRLGVDWIDAMGHARPETARGRDLRPPTGRARDRGARAHGIGHGFAGRSPRPAPARTGRSTWTRAARRLPRRRPEWRCTLEARTRSRTSAPSASRSRRRGGRLVPWASRRPKSCPASMHGAPRAGHPQPPRVPASRGHRREQPHDRRRSG